MWVCGYVGVWVCVCMHTLNPSMKGRRQLSGVAPSFYPVTPGDQTQVFRPGSKRLNPTNHLASH